MFLTADVSFGLARDAFDGEFAGIRGTVFFAERLFFPGFLGFPLVFRGLALPAMKAISLVVSVRQAPLSRPNHIHFKRKGTALLSFPVIAQPCAVSCFTSRSSCPTLFIGPPSTPFLPTFIIGSPFRFPSEWISTVHRRV